MTIERLSAALLCWRGSAFEEFAEFDWARLEQVRLDELRVNAREDLLEARLAHGEHAACVGEFEALIAESPLRERFRQQLIVALYRSGRSAEALRQADAFRRLLRDELGLEPSSVLQELEARVLNDDPTLLHTNTASRVSKPRHLPAETTPLVGRAVELDQLIDRLHNDRLLTLTGPGGVGKSRLAMRIANDLWDEFGGEVFVAELAPIHDPASTVAAIATALDVQQRQHLSVEETLVEYLRARKALLVLDNCEHLRAVVAPLADRLLSLCRDVTVLATSREVLGLPSEQVWHVGPLDVASEGSSATAASHAPAVQLFLERARAARPGYSPEPDDVSVIAGIVRRLDGLPLAIELAAARVRAMSPAALAERLDGQFEILAGSQTSMIARHRTLQDLVAWSYDLLGPDEQQLFGRLGVFAGTFGLDAAEGVCAGEDLSPARVSALLANLVDKSMVQLVNEHLPRYRLLETLREFGRDRIGRHERETVRDRHTRWYLDLVERSGQALSGPNEAAAMAALDRDYDNLRSAHVWSLEHSDVDIGVRLVVGLREYAFRCMHAEITNWAEAVSGLPGAAMHPRYPVLVAVAAYGRFVRGDLEAAIELGELAIAEANRLNVDCSGLAERALSSAASTAATRWAARRAWTG